MKSCFFLVFLTSFFFSFSQNIVISEFLYDSPLNEEIDFGYHHRGEFIELYNPGNEDVDLTGWYLKDGNPYTKTSIPSGTVIRSKGFIILTYGSSSDPAQIKLENIYNVPESERGKIFYFVGQGKILLNNTGDQISLYNNGTLVQEIAYGGGNGAGGLHWSITAAEGESLELIDSGPINNPSSTVPSNYKQATPNPFSLSFEPEIEPENLVVFELKENFVSVEVPRVSVKNDSDLLKLSSADKYHQISYKDALGRPFANLNVQVGQNFEDKISFYEYDSVGRMSTNYLPYLIENENSGGLRDDFIQEQQAFYDDLVGDRAAYSSIEFDTLGRPKFIIQPGENWHVADKKASQNQYFFAPENNGRVLHWRVDDGRIVHDRDYEKNELFISESIDPQGVKRREVKDGRGLSITSQIYDSQTNSWFGSYNVYDDMSRIVAVIPPLLIKQMNSFPNELTESQLNGFVFQYRYDQRGRVVGEKAPGAGWIEYRYDRWDRLVLQRFATQRIGSKDSWTFYKYDALNRVIMSGQLTWDSNNEVDEEWESDAQGRFDRAQSNNNDFGYTTLLSFPQFDVNDRNQVVTPYKVEIIEQIQYYDNYDFIGNSGLSTSTYKYNNPAGFIDVRDDRTTGLLTGSKTLILDSDYDWLHTVMYYDEKGRLIQSIADNHLGGADRTSSELDWEGKTLKVLQQHTTSALGDVDILSEFEYEHTGNLLQVYHTINEPGNQGDQVLLANYTYDLLGQLASRKLHSVEGSEFLQSVDYEYNIRGWLTGINDLELDDGDLFGMQFHFELPKTIKNGQTEARYDGLLSAISWNMTNKTPFENPVSGPKGTKKSIYGYTYDEKSQLKRARYAEGVDGEAFKENIGHFNESIYYDRNGNITSLFRKSDGEFIDKLQYSYEQNSNKLLSVSDNSSDEAGMDDYFDGTDYAYDQMGNMTYDLNKEIFEIAYNHLQLVKRISFDDGTTISYTYDAVGNKLAKTITDGSDNIIAKIDYVGIIEYLDDEINQIFTNEGRAFRQNDKYHYEYFITDHQGNNRVAFGSLPERNIHTATMEVNNAPSEESIFAFPENIRSIAENHTPLGAASIGLNGGLAGRKVGIGKVLDISPGDEVELEVWAKYNEQNWSSNTINNFFHTVVAALGTGTVLGNAAENFNSSLATTIDDPLPAALFNGNDSEEPHAYLEYMFFDKDYKFVPEGSGFLAVGPQSQGKFAKIKSEQPIVYDEEGYLLVYLANETLQDAYVFFDDLKITHSSANANYKVSQVNEYYPFGMLTANSWRNPSYIDPGLLYQSYYASYDSLTELNDFFLRNYDPALGRWLQTDPYNQFSSPYVGMANNPHMGVDPDGGFFWGTALAGAVLGGYSAGFASSGKLNPLDWSGRDRAWALGGAIVGGALGGFAFDRNPEYAKSYGRIHYTGHHTLDLSDELKKVGDFFRSIFSSGKFTVFAEETIWGPFIEDQAKEGIIVLNEFFLASRPGNRVMKPQDGIAILNRIFAPRRTFNGYLVDEMGITTGRLPPTTGVAPSPGKAAGIFKAARGSSTALRQVGKVFESVDDVLANSSLLKGQSYAQVRGVLNGSKGWVNSVMTKTRGADKGWVFRQVNGKGQPTGRLIQYHPGSRRHFGGNPYWKVSDGANTFRFPGN